MDYLTLSNVFLQRKLIVSGREQICLLQITRIPLKSTECNCTPVTWSFEALSTQ